MLKNSHTAVIWKILKILDLKIKQNYSRISPGVTRFSEPGHDKFL
jgi:hypothetical protein